MIPDLSFAKGMGMLCLAFNREHTPELTDLYNGILSPVLTDEQWKTAVRVAIERDRFFPTVAVLLSYGRPPEPASARAGEVYAELCDAYENLCGREAQWSPNADAIEARWGLAARRAFMACGGTRAFEFCEPRDEPFRLKAFREAFVETAKDDALALMPAALGGLLK